MLQIGADIYCDTALIADVLEERAPNPSLYPSGITSASRILAQWADSTLFWTAIPFAMQPAGIAHVFEGMPPEAIKAFADDRAVFRANLPRMRPADANAAFALYLERLEAMARMTNSAAAPRSALRTKLRPKSHQKISIHTVLPLANGWSRAGLMAAYVARRAAGVRQTR